MKNTILYIAIALVVIIVTWIAILNIAKESIIEEYSIPAVRDFPVAEETKNEVVITDSGFIPSELTISEGATVVFKNTGENDHWPASDAHPTHEVYSEFDPKKPVIPNALWSFTFDKQGEWAYHDHMYPTLTGTIYVVNDTSQQGIFSRVISTLRTFLLKTPTSESLPSNKDHTGDDTSLTNTTYNNADEYSIEELQASYELDCESTDQSCISDAIKNFTVEYGPNIAIEMLEYMMKDKRISRAVDDHQLSHEIGREAARVYGVNSKSFLLCPMSAFNGGCQHGFFEYVLGRTGTATEAANLICSSLGEDYSAKFKFYCYHGVGHGIMMQQAYDLDAALKICDSFEKLYTQDGCWQGVFMENTNSVMTGYADREDVFSAEDPLAPCNKIDDKYRHECYINHAGYLMMFFNNSIEDAAKSCLKAGNWTSSCMQTLGLMVSNSSWQFSLHPNAKDLGEAKTAWELCELFPEGNVHDCVRGAIDNINNFDEFDITRANTFCSLIDTPFQEKCWLAIGGNLMSNATDADQVISACQKLNTEGQKLCLSATGQ
jgi:plastocyanin